MCEFKDTEIGNIAELFIPYMSCEVCGQEMENITLSTSYIGHKHYKQSIRDFFEVITDFHCPGCGEKIVKYGNECEDFVSNAE